MSVNVSLYQQMILDHNKKPRNFKKIDPCTHSAEGFNPLCGDHLWVYLNVQEDGIISDVGFEGSGCAISKAAGSLLTIAIKGQKMSQAQLLFAEFQKLLTGKLDPEKDPHILGKLKVFSGIWKYPSRVKCASLAARAMSGALCQTQKISTEE